MARSTMSNSRGMTLGRLAPLVLGLALVSVSYQYYALRMQHDVLLADNEALGLEHEALEREFAGLKTDFADKERARRSLE